MLKLLLLKLGTVTGFLLGWVALNSTSEPRRPSLTKTVHTFSVGCEHLVGALMKHEPLTDEEIRLVEHYCNEVLKHLHAEQRGSAPEATSDTSVAKVKV